MNYLFDEDEFCPDKNLVSMLTGNECRMRKTNMLPVHAQKIKTCYVMGFGQLMNVDIRDMTSLHLMTAGQIDLTTLVLWLTKKFGQLKRAMVTAWSFGGDDIDMLRQMVAEKKIMNLDILASDMHPKKHKADHAEMLRMKDNGLIRHYYVAPIHCKMVLAETADGNFVVIDSTANCTLYSTHLEMNVVTFSKEVYDFYNSVFADLYQFEI